MRQCAKHKTALVACLLLAGMALAGCSTPVEKAYTLGTLYHQAQLDVTAARQQHLISDAAFQPIADADQTAEPLVQESLRSAVQAEAEKVPWTKTFQFNKAFDAARTAVRTLLTRLAEAKTSK